MSISPRFGRRVGKSEPMPVWGRWLIGSVLAVILIIWLFLARYWVFNGFVSFLGGVVPFLERALVLVIYAFLLGLYFIPYSCARNTPRESAIFIANLVLGWTIIGWLAVLVWALAEKGTAKASKLTAPP